MLDVDCVYANVHQVDLAKEHDGTTAKEREMTPDCRASITMRIGKTG
jgi:hypothetical protein